jgi:hypothetical protein
LEEFNLCNVFMIIFCAYYLYSIWFLCQSQMESQWLSKPIKTWQAHLFNIVLKWCNTPIIFTTDMLTSDSENLIPSYFKKNSKWTSTYALCHTFKSQPNFVEKWKLHKAVCQTKVHRKDWIWFNILLTVTYLSFEWFC